MQDCLCHSSYQFFLTDTMGTALLFIKGSRTYIIVVDFIRAFQYHAFFTVPTFYQAGKKRQPLCTPHGIHFHQVAYHFILMSVDNRLKGIFIPYPLGFLFVDHNLYFMVWRCCFSLYQHSGIAFIKKDTAYHSWHPDRFFRQAEPCL